MSTLTIGGTGMTMSEGGTKYDAGKEPIDLLDPDYLFGTARVLAFGAGKYAPYNWAEGMKWSRVFAALMRHMWKWWRGEDRDEETGEYHLYHASCCLMFLARYQMDGTGEDDRYKGYTNKNKKEINDNLAKSNTISGYAGATYDDPFPFKFYGAPATAAAAGYGTAVVKRWVPDVQENVRPATPEDGPLHWG